jgi:hypothetical protein
MNIFAKNKKHKVHFFILNYIIVDFNIYQLK